jgi:hypothetical protein
MAYEDDEDYRKANMQEAQILKMMKITEKQIYKKHDGLFIWYKLMRETFIYICS